MPRTLAFFLSTILFLSASAQDSVWTGGGLYKPGDPVGELLKSFAGEKKMVLRVNKNGEINGTLDVTYNKSVRPSDAVNAGFTIMGAYDSAKHRLLLVVTHVKAAGMGAEKKLKYPDSVYYAVNTEERKGRITITGSIDTKNHALTTEWIKSTQLHIQAIPGSRLDMHFLPLHISLEKSADAGETTAAPPVAAKNPPVVAQPPAAVTAGAALAKIEKRKPEIQSTILLDTSLITLDLYDNGEVDGDIATLILDGIEIISNQLLSTKAASLTINLTGDKPEHLLELYALNEGTIPPNAALVVLTCNRKRYEINLSSNGAKNGSVKLVVAKK